MASVVIIGSGITGASAADIEKLVMPGALIEGHADVEGDCDSCHVAFARDKQRDLCLGCHEDVATDLEQGIGYHGRDDAARDAQCAGCHADHIGRDADVVGLNPDLFDHALTDFELSGAHAETKCEDCHVADEKFRDAPSLCVDCHREDDAHDGGLGQECETCHRTTDWLETKFDHEGETGFALEGAHGQTDCADCHRNDVYENTPTDCFACHEADDSHEGLNGAKCEACHGTGRWPEYFFDHATDTSFALTGEHAEAACGDCHTEPVFDVSLESDCYSCHRDDDEHDGVNGQACGECHTTRAWTAVSFDHEVDAGFALRGSHAQLVCGDCHVVPVEQASPATDCYGCHEEDDPHAAQLGKSCGQCHGEVGWTEAVVFDHGLTNFPLIGAHAAADCDGCHETSRFHDSPDQCVDCHRDDDIHQRALGQACGECHNPVDWARWTFDHGVQTAFGLDGAHARLACVACHKRPLEDQLSRDTNCAACHRADDVHRGEFGKDCERCHTTRDFRAVERMQ